MEAPVSNTELHRVMGTQDMSSAPATQDTVPCNIQLPKQLESVKAAQTCPKVRHRWNTNEEIASILISFEKHADWLKHEINLRPPSGCMLLFNRNNVRYRKDGYCWKKRKDGKNIREDHMKLKVQGLECIYGSYVHSAILPTFHRRCYWLLQNTDIVLVHYLNVPYPNNTKLSIPIMSFAMEKKEWTKEELVEQLKPMFSTCDGEGVPTSSFQSSKIDETIMTLVQKLIDSQDKKRKEVPSTSDCAKNCLHTIQPDSAGPTPGQGHNCCHGNTSTNQGGGNTASVSQTQDGRGSVDLTQGPLILNLGNLANGGGVMLMTGETSNTMQLSIVTNTTNTGQLPSWSQAHSKVCTPTTTHNSYEQNTAAGHNYQSQQSCCNCSSFSALQPNQGMLHPTHAQSQGQGQSYRNKDDSGFVAMTSCQSSAEGQNCCNYEQSIHRCHQVHNDKTGPGITTAMTLNTQQLPSNHCYQGNMETSQEALNKAMMDQSNASIKAESMQQSHSANSLQQLVETTTDIYPIQSTVSNSDVLNSLVDDLNLELMATDTVKESLPGSSSRKNSFDHLGDSFESLQASLNSLHGSDLNLDQLDLIDMPDLDRIYHDISNNSNMNSQNPQGHVGVQNHLNDGISFNNMQEQNIGVLSRDLSHSRQSLCSHNSTDCGSISLDNNGVAVINEMSSVAINSNMSSSHQNSSGSFSHNITVLPPNQQFNSGEDNLTHSRKPTKSIALITDFSPDWTYTEGQTKVLVTGPWCSTRGTYSVMLGGKVIATTLVQDGVLRCFVPGHPVGFVPLEVSCDGHVISNTVVFEFREHPKPVHDTTQSPADWFSVEDSCLLQKMIDKLDHIESALSKVPDFTHIKQTIASLSDHSQIEQDNCLTQHLKSLSSRLWMTNDLSAENGWMGLSLLHLAAALGYSNFIKTLIKWRNENPCWLLEYEVDANSTDLNTCSPLMWACARGHKDAAIILYNWNKGPLHTPNREGNLPLIVARQRGHHKLADHLELMDSIDTLSHDQCSVKSFENICKTQTRFSQDGNHPTCSTINSVTSICSTPEKICFTNDIPAATSTPVSKDSIDRLNVFKSPQVMTESSKSTQSLGELHIDIPSYNTGTSTGPRVPTHDKLVRRQSDQMLQVSSQHMPPTNTKHSTPSSAAERRQKLKKRLSVDILPYQSSTEAVSYSSNSFQRPIREANSEPHLSGNDMEHLLCESNPMLSEGGEIGSPELFMQMDVRRVNPATEQENSTQPVTMDTDELSDGSGTSFIDVERVSDDDDDDLTRKVALGGDPENPQHQMVHLAKQIIAAMPERIKSSPSRSDEVQPAEECERERSSSYSSLQSASPRASSSYGEALSSYGEDSGISTPMRDSLAFDEYRYSDVYSDLGTPASSLSPDSTCLHSPYSPYSFHLDSPPPTTAEFVEYFNAPATFMEKDFSQLTLSDIEQRKLYEAAKVIQSAYRIYKDKLSKQSQQKREIMAAVLIQSYYRRYKQYAYYKKMTQAAVLIQSQFRSYYAQKRFKKSRDAAVVIQNQYRSYKEHERLKKGGNKSVTQRYRSHYQRKPIGSGSKTSRVVQIVPDTADGSQPEQINTAIDDCPHDTSSNTVTADDENTEKGQTT